MSETKPGNALMQRYREGRAEAERQELLAQIPQGPKKRGRPQRLQTVDDVMNDRFYRVAMQARLQNPGATQAQVLQQIESEMKTHEKMLSWDGLKSRLNRMWLGMTFDLALIAAIRDSDQIEKEMKATPGYRLDYNKPVMPQIERWKAYKARQLELRDASI